MCIPYPTTRHSMPYTHTHKHTWLFTNNNIFTTTTTSRTQHETDKFTKRARKASSDQENAMYLLVFHSWLAAHQRSAFAILLNGGSVGMKVWQPSFSNHRRFKNEKFCSIHSCTYVVDACILTSPLQFLTTTTTVAVRQLHSTAQVSYLSIY